MGFYQADVHASCGWQFWLKSLEGGFIMGFSPLFVFSLYRFATLLPTLYIILCEYPKLSRNCDVQFRNLGFWFTCQSVPHCVLRSRRGGYAWVGIPGSVDITQVVGNIVSFCVL